MLKFLLFLAARICRATGLASLFALMFLTISGDSRVAAHELSAAVMDLSFPDEGTRVVGVIEMNLEAYLAGIGAEHDDSEDSPQAAQYNELRALAPEALGALFSGQADAFAARITARAGEDAVALQVDGVEPGPLGDIETERLSVVTVSGALPAGAQAVAIGWDAALGDLIVRTGDAENEGFAAYLSGGELTSPISVAGPTSEPFMTTLGNYIWIGFEHIIPMGLDHILFVVGLFLLATAWRPLLWQVTSFTIAHSITLGLGMLGILRIPPEVVEPIIAASIVYVAVENVLSPTMTRWRPLMVFAFGLLHGLGFAGVLTEFGMPRDQFVAALIGFNVGVELGQLAVIAICFALVGLWFGSKPWYRARITIPASLIVAAIGAYWVVERTLL